MSKTKISFTVSSQGEVESRRRRPCGVDGTVSGGTKVVSNKGKKVYNRKRANKPNNW